MAVGNKFHSSGMATEENAVPLSLEMKRQLKVEDFSQVCSRATVLVNMKELEKVISNMLEITHSALLAVSSDP